MLSLIFYIFYISLFFVTFYFCIKCPIKLIYPLIFSSQFNVTSFFKFGMTFSFFEINLFISIFTILFFYSKEIVIKYKIKFTESDKIFSLFLLISIISIFIGIIRVLLNNLSPDKYIVTPFYLRSFMSLNKIFIYLPFLIFLRTKLLNLYSNNILQNTFLKALAISGILPALAAILQFSNIGFYLIHNNPSFSESFRIEDYHGVRIVGLTNEASFFVYQLFFPTLAIYYCWIKKLLNKKYLKIILSIYILTVVISISRTGLLIYFIFLLLILFREYRMNFNLIIKSLFIIIPLTILLSNINIIGFNLLERLISTFQYSSDSSTLERYGSMQALLNLLLSKSIIIGVGIYNYQYYIKQYLPDYMNVFNYGNGDTPTSFNFLLQILVEFGLLFSLIFFLISIKLLKKNKNINFQKDWFIFLLIFSLSFQTLNFSIPFLILLYPNGNINENTLRT